MLNVKCFHCGKSFALNTELVAAWLEEQQGKKTRHYSTQCRFCRRVIKVPISQIRRGLPRVENKSGN